MADAPRIVSASYDMTKGVDTQTKNLVEHAKSRDMNLVYTSSVPMPVIEKWAAEVAGLKPKDRKKWKSTIVDTFGQKSVVRYDEVGRSIPGKQYVSHFLSNLSGQKQGKLLTNQKYRPIVPIGLPVVEGVQHVVELRRGNDSMLDDLPASSQNDALEIQTRANATGNHVGRNHFTRVPVRPGEPVRG